ncbi:MAG: aspartate aminotransferase family protein [Thermodesulfobacteriota bacterium]
MKSEKSQALTQRFNQLYPGGHTNYRVPLYATQHRVFVDRAMGSRVWDVDGNEYIDYIGAMGPTILGHRHPEYVQALKECLDGYPTALGSGILFSEDDVMVAEKLIKHVPCAEKVKFCVTGSEAVQMAIRLARAYTGRPYFIRFSGHYHGWLDNVLGGQVRPESEGRPFAWDDPNSDPFTDYCYTQGKAKGAVEESFLLPWNDLDRLEKTISRYGEEIALIHFEPLVCNHFCLMPKPGFLERVRELCTRHGIVMSFDEVITGFRLGLSGAQGYFGVTPDMATLGKALAGGLPFSAVVGKAEIMNLLEEQKVLGPGTFNGYPLGMKAARATIEILERDDGAAYKRLDEIQNLLTQGLADLAQKHGLPLLIQGATGVFFTMFGLKKDAVAYTDQDLESLDFDRYFVWWLGMQDEGILTLVGGRWYPSIAHTREDVARTLEAAERVMSSLPSSKG